MQLPVNSQLLFVYLSCTVSEILSRVHECEAYITANNLEQYFNSVTTVKISSSRDASCHWIFC